MKFKSWLLYIVLCVTSFNLWAKTELRLWHSQGYTKSFWQAIADDFSQQHPDIKIQISIIPWKSLNPSLSQAVFSNKAPEMVLFQSDNLGIKNIFKLSSVPSSLLSDSLLPELDFFVYQNGVPYGIPLTHGNHLVLYYNKRIVEKPAASWQELTEQSKMLDKQYKFLAFDYYSAYGFVSFLNAFDPKFAISNNLSLDTPEMIKTLEFFKKNTDNRVFDINCGYICAREAFLTGEYAYAINGDWEYSRIYQELGDDLGVALLPSISGKPIVSMKSALLLVFPNQSLTSNKRDALIKFSEYVQSKAVAKRVYHETQSMPTHSEAMQDLVENGGNNFKWFIQQLKMSKPMPSSSEMASVWDSIEKGLELYITGELSAENAAKYMNKKAQYEKRKITAKAKNDN
ncbi:extracellular solute-binding protein [Catenovulum maritimum]|uniref:Sugar ABC transporter substrate-binding protein n=1 Tax=Catenovulum maritimum TaxID=1513271 RepID=A0A0J8JI58_9ALTE|nr:extracellular solute-binding protein [Catenovulum maritimum]KMT64141.1 hypothetical protein XM47_15825 [Catenovulum maritimum]